jgi:hypothetical protein
LWTPAVWAEKGKSEGVYVDATGGRHPWEVTASHALVWEGQPYCPAGVVFHSRFLAEPSEATFAADRDAIERLRTAEIQDVWIDPGRGLMSCRPEEVQRLVNLFEARGFRYGLAVQDRSTESLRGYAPPMDPLPVPAVAMQSGGRFQWTARVRDASRVQYTLVDVQSELVLAAGEVPVVDGVAAIEVTLRKSRLIGKGRGALYLLPLREVSPAEAAGFPDLWRAVTSYQERLTAFLNEVRFGPGFRFVLNPFDPGRGLTGAENDLFPASPEYRADFCAWLRRRTNITDINFRWGLTQNHLHELEVAARLVPTWPAQDAPEGTGWLVDPVEGKAYPVAARQCRIWQDYRDFRGDSLKRAMAATAVALRNGGPAVPVVFGWEGYQPLYDRLEASAGYDGIAATLRGQGRTLATEGAACALAQVEQSTLNWWFVAGRVSPPAGPGSLSVRRSVADDWQALRDVGVKGFYLESSGTIPDPATLQELKEVRTTLADDRDLATYRPRVCYFPAALPNSGRVARLSNGVWWLPSLGAARQVRLGPQLSGYVIEQPFGNDRQDVHVGLILWSPTGRREATFAVDPETKLSLMDSRGTPVPARISKKQQLLHLSLTDEPVIASGISADKAEQLFPMEAAAAAVAEYDALLRDAEAQGMDTKAQRLTYAEAKKALTPTAAGQVYTMISRPLQQLRDALSPYYWIEGEQPLQHTFLGSAFQNGASDGRYLMLDNQRAPRGEEGYQAQYVLNILKSGTYEIWVAGRAPGRPGVSPIAWNIDKEATTAVREVPAGQEYAPGFEWYRIGKASFQAGRHVLTLAVPERAPGEGGRYVFGVDALLLSRVPFEPHGTEKPNYRGAAAREAADGTTGGNVGARF